MTVEINPGPGWLLRDVRRAARDVAERRAYDAKRRMDDALAALDVAEAEWLTAEKECERLYEQSYSAAYGEPVIDTRPSEVIVREMRDNDWPDRQSGDDT